MKEEGTPLVSIITVNYRQAAVTLALLESLSRISYPNTEVIVADNSADEQEVNHLREKAPWATVVTANRNLGFAGGNNLAVSACKGSLLLFINNDVEVPEGFLEPLVAAMRQPGTGMVSPKIKYFYQPDTIQYAGSTQLSYITMRNRAIGSGEKDTGQYDTPCQTAYVHGAAMMTSREVVNRVGVMYDGYFLYYEELDWCERVKRAGYTIRFVPDSEIFHKESVSTGKMSPLKTYYINRNRLLFLRRNTRGMIRLAGIAYFVAVAFPKRLVSAILKNEHEHCRALVRALLWHLKPERYEYRS